MDTYLLEFRIKPQYYAGGINQDMIQEVKKAIIQVFPDTTLAFCSPEPEWADARPTLLFMGSKVRLLVQFHESGILAVNVDCYDIVGYSCEQKIEEFGKTMRGCNFYMKPNSAVLEVLPSLKRGREFGRYDTSSGMLVQRDFEKVVFDGTSPYQHVLIMKSTQYGNILYLDGDLNLAESDLEYTRAITGYDDENYTDKSVLILGGGDGGILHHLRDRGAKFITMIDIDQMVVDAAKIHLRGICHDAMDSLKGSNYEVIVDDCVTYLEKYVAEGKKFDYIINDLTAIPVSTSPVGDLWDFMRKILSLSMKVLAEDGKYYTQGNSQLRPKALAMYEEQLQKLGCPVKFEKRVVCVPSYLENWIFYKIWKDI